MTGRPGQKPGFDLLGNRDATFLVTLDQFWMTRSVSLVEVPQKDAWHRQ